MIAKISFLVVTLFVQEFVLLNTLFLAAHQGLYSPLLIFILFVIATIIDIVIGYYVGIYLRKKTSQTKFGKYIQRQSERFSFSKDSPKRWFSLLVLGNISFCYINAALAGYLGLPFWESQAYNFAGNIAGYITAWYVIGSVNSVFKNNYISIGIIVLVSLLILVILRKRSIKKI